MVVSRELLQDMLELARNAHPNETIFLLRGKREKHKFVLEEILIPPLAVGGPYYSFFDPYVLPVDFSILGVGHSHPTGDLRLSVTDLNKGYGLLTLVLAFPYRDERDVAVYDSDGRKLELLVVS